MRKSGGNKRTRLFAAVVSIALVLTTCPEIPETLCVLAAETTTEEVAEAEITETTEEAAGEEIDTSEAENQDGEAESEAGTETEETTEAERGKNKESENESTEVTESEAETEREKESEVVTETEIVTELETAETKAAEPESLEAAETEDETLTEPENELAETEEETVTVMLEENTESDSEAITETETETAEQETESETGTEDYLISEDLCIIGFLENPGFVYDGTKQTQNIAIYYKGKLLTENTDYTITYKNNVNAASYTEENAPSMTVKMKGQYSGSRTFYFTIDPLDLSDISVSAVENTVIKQGTAKFPTMTLYRNGTKLKAGTDFINPTVDGLQSMEVGSYTVSVSGTGNYCGTREVSYCIASKNEQDNFAKKGKVNLNTNSTVYYDGTKESAMPSVTVTMGQNVIDLSKDLTGTEQEGWFTVTYSGKKGESLEQVIQEHGTAVITVTAEKASGFYGSKTISYKIDGSRTLNKTTVKGSEFWKDSIEYSEDKMTSEGIVQCSEAAKGLLIWNGDGTLLVEGEDYLISGYKNNKKAGTATVVFAGIGKYRGKYSKTFTITPGEQLYVIAIGGVDCKDEATVPKMAYTKNAVTPEIIVSADKEGTQILTNKKDYTITYSNNKNVGETATVKIMGKGNYKGAGAERTFQIVAADIGNLSIAVPDVKYNSKNPQNYTSNPVITDTNGKKLAAGKDYETEFVYSYDRMSDKQYPQPADTVTITVAGKGNYTNTIQGTYHIYEADKDISKLFFSFDKMTYTGEAIEPSYDDIHVYYTKTDMQKGINEITGEEEKSLYCITGYANNIKSGSGKITLRGLGKYGGTKTYQFVISKKAYDYQKVESIAFQLDEGETSITMVTGGERTLSVKILPENASNKVVLWSSTDEDIVSIEADAENTASAVLSAKKTGSVTIKARSQDSGVTVSCVVEVQTSSLKLNKDMLKGKAGESARLTATITPSMIADSPVTWESSNENVAMVTSEGVVTFVSGGVAFITAKAEQYGLEAQCFVTVEGELANYVSVTDFGAVPDDGNDDTEAFSSAFAALESGQYEGFDTVYVPAGTYHINPKYGIVMKSRTKLYMEDDTVLQAIQCSSSENQVIGVYVSDVEISGGTIIGELRAAAKSGEGGMGIRVQNANNVYIHDVSIKECRGDGILLGGNGTGSKNIIIESCKISDTSRNGLGIVSAHNIYVESCQITGAGSLYGTAPKSCILIEKNSTDNVCTDIVIKNSYIDNKAVCSSDSNAYAFGSAWVNYPDSPVIQGDRLTAENCTFKGKVANYSVTNAKFINCTFDGEKIFKQDTVVE